MSLKITEQSTDADNEFPILITNDIQTYRENDQMIIMMCNKIKQKKKHEYIESQVKQ